MVSKGAADASSSFLILRQVTNLQTLRELDPQICPNMVGFSPPKGVITGRNSPQSGYFIEGQECSSGFQGEHPLEMKLVTAYRDYRQSFSRD